MQEQLKEIQDGGQMVSEFFDCTNILYAAKRAGCGPAPEYDPAHAAERGQPAESGKRERAASSAATGAADRRGADGSPQKPADHDGPTPATRETRF